MRLVILRNNSIYIQNNKKKSPQENSYARFSCSVSGTMEQINKLVRMARVRHKLNLLIVPMRQHLKRGRRVQLRINNAVMKYMNMYCNFYTGNNTILYHKIWAFNALITWNHNKPDMFHHMFLFSCTAAMHCSRLATYSPISLHLWGRKKCLSSKQDWAENPRNQALYGICRLWAERWPAQYQKVSGGDAGMAYPGCNSQVKFYLWKSVCQPVLVHGMECFILSNVGTKTPQTIQGNCM